jgi:uncharacterized membrane protein
MCPPHVPVLPAGLELAVAATWLKRAVVAISDAIILVAVSIALVRLAQVRLRGATDTARMTLARGLSLAWICSTPADIGGTAIPLDWEQTGKLAATAAIRTFPICFLQREIAQEEQPPTRPEAGVIRNPPLQDHCELAASCARGLIIRLLRPTSTTERRAARRGSETAPWPIPHWLSR